MELRYTVEHGAQGWGVYEGGQALSLSHSRAGDLEIARLLTIATRAAGGDARLVETPADERPQPG